MSAEHNNQQTTTVSNEQIRDAAAAGLELLEADTTLIPSPLRRRIGLLELLLQQLAAGHAVLANPPAAPVESSKTTGRKSRKKPTRK